MKKILSFALAVMMLCLCFTSCGEKTIKAEPFNAVVSVDTTGHTLHHIEIVIKDYGTVTLALDETVAPITVKNFMGLAEKGFFDGLPITRVQRGFVLQGGQSQEYTPSIKGEFASNGFENKLSHTKGVISMARTEEPDSASSQFFIMLADNTGLDGDYAAFGWVTSGMNIIDAINEDITSDDYDTSNYRLYTMCFLKPESMLTIKTIKVID